MEVGPQSDLESVDMDIEVPDAVGSANLIVPQRNDTPTQDEELKPIESIVSLSSNRPPMVPPGLNPPVLGNKVAFSMKANSSTRRAPMSNIFGDDVPEDKPKLSRFEPHELPPLPQVEPHGPLADQPPVADSTEAEPECFPVSEVLSSREEPPAKILTPRNSVGNLIAIIPSEDSPVKDRPPLSSPPVVSSQSTPLPSVEVTQGEPGAKEDFASEASAVENPPPPPPMEEFEFKPIDKFKRHIWQQRMKKEEEEAPKASSAPVTPIDEKPLTPVGGKRGKKGRRAASVHADSSEDADSTPNRRRSSRLKNLEEKKGKKDEPKEEKEATLEVKVEEPAPPPPPVMDSDKGNVTVTVAPEVKQEEPSAPLVEKKEEFVSPSVRPEKVKSRWRRWSELEATSTTIDAFPPPPPVAPVKEEPEKVGLASQIMALAKMNTNNLPPPPVTMATTALATDSGEGQSLVLEQPPKTEEDSKPPEFDEIMDNIFLSDRSAQSPFFIISCNFSIECCISVQLALVPCL